MCPKQLAGTLRVPQPLVCVNHSWSWKGFPPCRSAFHPRCYSVDPGRWPTVLPERTHADRGLAARAGDAVIRNNWVCELCVVRAQTGAEVTPESAPLLELQRASILTRWNDLSDSYVRDVALKAETLRRMDEKLPAGCVSSVGPRLMPPRWPEPSRMVTGRWHLLELARTGGKQDHGGRSMGSVLSYSTAMFNDMREAVVDDEAMIRFESKTLRVPGSMGTESLGHQLFVSGLRTRQGEMREQAWPMPASIARALEREFVMIFHKAKTNWARYQAALAVLANDAYFSLIFRGNEPFCIKALGFARELALESPCPWCKQRHVSFPVTERTKKDRHSRGFDMVCVPVTGAGLQVGEAARRALECRAAVPANSPYLFCKQDGTVWTSAFFRKEWLLPALRRLSVQGHPDLARFPWGSVQGTTIRMYRRGGTKWLRSCDVSQPTLDLMGRWQAQPTKMPNVMRL